MRDAIFAGRPVVAAIGAFALAGLASGATAQPSPSTSSGIAPPSAGPSPPAASPSLPSTSSGASSTPTQVGEVVVTATRRAIAAEKVGVSLTVVGAEDLKVLAPSRLEDLAGSAPNVFIGEEVGAPNQSLLFIRGQGYADVEEDQATPVGVIQDGVAYGSSTGQLASMFDVCSVEVDRGPQGIFYGKNTSAGLININRCAPTRQYGAQFSAGYGSYQDGFGRAVLNAPLGEHGGFKVAAQYHTNDGYVKDVFDNKHVGGDHMFAINAVVNYDVTPWLNANLAYDHTSESGGGNPVQYGDPETAAVFGINKSNDPLFNPTTGSPIGLAPREVDVRPGSVNDTYGNDVLSLILKANTPLGQAVSQTAFVDQRDTDDQDYDGTCQFYPGCTGLPNMGNAIIKVPLEVARDQTYQQFTQEERLSGSYGPFDYILGAFYDHQDFTLHEVNDLEPVVTTDQHSGQSSHSWSEFGNLDWNPTSAIKLSAGLRNISETKTATTEFDVGGFPILAQPSYTFSHTWSHVVTRVNAQWQVVPQTLLYANRSQGFRSGGFSVRGTLSEAVPGQTNYSPGADFLEFAPETNVTYEIGIKNRLFGNSLILNVDAFHNTVKNFQQTSVIVTTGFGPGTNTYVINIPEVVIKGVEMEAVLKPGRFIPMLEGFTIQGNLGIQSGRITNGRVNGQEFATATGVGGPPGSTADLTGTALQRLPTDNYTVRGIYVHDLFTGKLTTTIGYTWTAKYSLGDLTPQTPDFQPSYHLLDASVTYDWKNDYVKLSGKNLTNSNYRQFSLSPDFIQSWAPPATAEIEVGGKF